MSEVLGIHQSDVVIRSALMAGLQELRDDPSLLDDVFASLPADSLTNGTYGFEEVERAKEWFLKSDIPVFMNTRVDEAKFPAISIELQESVESEVTLGDVHYVPVEGIEADWPVIAGPFAPTAFSPSSGIMKLPASVTNSAVVAAGMSLLDNTGKAHVIQDVLDSETITLAAGTNADFSKAYLKGTKPKLVRMLESLSFRETYSIGLWAQGEAVQLTWLYSIVAFVLLRSKETLLEARGFERSTLAWSKSSRNDQTENELVFNRFCSITGYVRQYWPKSKRPGLEIATGTFTVAGQHTDGDGENDTGTDPTGDESWLAEQDALLVRL